MRKTRRVEHGQNREETREGSEKGENGEERREREEKGEGREHRRKKGENSEENREDLYSIHLEKPYLF